MQTRRRLPAEWEPHEAILLGFPHNSRDWPGKFEAAQWAFVDFIKKITTFEKLYLFVKNTVHKNNALAMLTKNHVDVSQIQFIEQDTNRGWMRDCGPVIVYDQDDKREVLQFNFNAWAKYTNFRKDRNVPEKTAAFMQLPLTKTLFKNKHVVLEGGAIDGNGNGVLLTTEECLLDPDTQIRNKGFEKSDYEALFLEYFGVEQVIWLKKGIVGDDTHGHVDDISRFVNENTVITCVESNPKDENYTLLQENLSILRQTRLNNGKVLQIVELPMPHPVYFDGMRLPASYANFLILNQAVLVPTFNDANDAKAIQIIQDCFPKRTVIGIHALDLVWGLGTLHCLSHELPAKKS
ncbi:MAG: agmatine deiminase family protein [Bacteroidetes bacterium]|nr:agmatine deiminase family protein [Bacteroidota bacterium]